MRVTLRSLVAVGFLSFTGADCCGVGGPELVPERDACASFYECSIAVKSNVFAISTFPTSPVVAVDVDPPELLEVRLDGNRVALRPRLAGEGIIRVALADGSISEAWVRAGALASTRVVPADVRVRPGPVAIYRGGEMRVMAEHLDERGGRMLGHGLEAWAIDGGALREVAPDDPLLVPDLQRIVVAGDGVAATVTARADSTPLELDIVRPGGTASLAVSVGPVPLTGERTVILQRGGSATLTVVPFTDDGRPIQGLPALAGLEASSSSAAFTAVVVRETREVKVNAVGAGEGDLEIRLDGLAVRFHIQST